MTASCGVYFATLGFTELRDRAYHPSTVADRFVCVGSAGVRPHACNCVCTHVHAVKHMGWNPCMQLSSGDNLQTLSSLTIAGCRTLLRPVFCNLISLSIAYHVTCSYALLSIMVVAVCWDCRNIILCFW